MPRDALRAALLDAGASPELADQAAKEAAARDALGAAFLHLERKVFGVFAVALFGVGGLLTVAVLAWGP